MPGEACWIQIWSDHTDHSNANTRFVYRVSFNLDIKVQKSGMAGFKSGAISLITLMQTLDLCTAKRLCFVRFRYLSLEIRSVSLPFLPQSYVHELTLHSSEIVKMMCL